MGKFYKTLSPVSFDWSIFVYRYDIKIYFKGLNFLLPIFDTIRYVQSLKEIAIEIPSQTAISKGSKKVFYILLLNFSLDNVTLSIDGVLYLKVFDPYLVSSENSLIEILNSTSIRLVMVLKMQNLL